MVPEGSGSVWGGVILGVRGAEKKVHYYMKFGQNYLRRETDTTSGSKMELRLKTFLLIPTALTEKVLPDPLFAYDSEVFLLPQKRTP